MKKFLFFVAFASFASCKKPDTVNQLPQPSSSGKNFLACKVNGVLHQYSGLNDWNTRKGVNYLRFADEIAIVAGDVKYNDAIGVHVKSSPDSVAPGVTYSFGSEVGSHYGGYSFNGTSTQPPLEYRTSVNSGWVRFSRVDSAVSAGTFAFTAYVETPRGVDSVVITEGVFDIAAE